MECTLNFAREMVNKGMLRGIISCPEHGHHNPYHMYKTGEDMPALHTPEVKDETH